MNVPCNVYCIVHCTAPTPTSSGISMNPLVKSSGGKMHQSFTSGEIKKKAPANELSNKTANTPVNETANAIAKVKMNPLDSTKTLMGHYMQLTLVAQLLKVTSTQVKALTTHALLLHLTSWKKAALRKSLALVVLVLSEALSNQVCAAYQLPLAPLSQDASDVSSAFMLQGSLDETDLKILKALSEGKGKKLSSKPVVNAPDQVSFIYGASRPTLVCSLLHVCDIALEPGENVVDLKAGDSARWIIERSASGSPQGIIEHIAVKPTDTGLTSNLRIYTDRRTYYLDLKSTTSDFMPSIKFVYPENSLQKYAQIKAQLQQQQAQIARNTVHTAERSFNLSELNFAYKLQGDKQLRPLRVFNDRRKTYIQMPPEIMQQGRMPALVAVHESGGLFSDDKTAIINYRILDNSFIVDGLYPHLRLILGQQSSHALSADIELMES